MTCYHLRIKSVLVIRKMMELYQIAVKILLLVDLVIYFILYITLIDSFVEYVEHVHRERLANAENENVHN